MKLVIGLGNPGDKYLNTRHNIGFMVLEKITEKKNIVMRNEPVYAAKFAEMGDLDNRIKFVEPQTFMNDSGVAVQKTKDYWKVDSEDIWVIHDDVDLEFGVVKIKLGGSSAGHKGVQSIIDHIGGEFWRIRVGVGRSEEISTEDWVLKNFEEDKKEKLQKIIDNIADFVLESLSKEIKEQTINIK